jgi:hypothetical protein
MADEDILDGKRQLDHLSVVRSLAEEFQVSRPDVERIYAATLNELRTSARIDNFLPLLVIRRTKVALSAFKRGLPAAEKSA